MAERARDAVSTVPVRGIELSCSAGVAAYPDDAEDASSLCQLAEGALYWAKRRGKGRTRRFDPGHVPLGWTRRGASRGRRAARRPSSRSRRCSSRWWPSRAGTWWATRRCRGSRTPPSARPRPGSPRPTGAGSGPTSRRPRSGPPSSRWGGRSGPISRSTSARRRSPPSPVIRSLPRDLTGIVIEITEHEFVSDDDHLADVLAELRERGALIAHRRRRRRLRGADPGRCASGPTSSSSTETSPRDSRRPGEDGARGVVRSLRPANRRDRLRGGDREPGRAGGARRPRRPMGTGLRAGRPVRAVGAGLAGRRRGLPRFARPGASRQPDRERPDRRRATGGSST